MNTRSFATIALILALAALPTAAQNDPLYGKTRTNRLNLTEAGKWDGTWFYVSRDVRFAVWMRTGDAGRPELKAQYFGMNTTESFVTDWTGHVEYALKNNPARFDLTIDESGPHMIKATWDWVFEVAGEGARNQSAKLTIFRTGDGRRMVFKFDDFEYVIRRSGEEQRHTPNQSWTFVKASKRIIPWSELPF